MRRFTPAITTLPALVAAGLLLGACAESQLRDQADFGDAARQDRAAQIADPDAHYAGVPGPASNGMRIDAAQERYVKGSVIQPAATETSTVSPGGSNGTALSGGSPGPSSGQ